MIAKNVRRVRQALTTARKQKIRAARDWRCWRCGKPCLPNKFGRSELEVNHIKPVALGGTNDDSNLEALCRLCHQNNHKPMRFVAGHRITLIEGFDGLSRFNSGRSNPAKNGNTEPLLVQESENTAMATITGGGAGTEDGPQWLAEEGLEDGYEIKSSNFELHPADTVLMEFVNFRLAKSKFKEGDVNVLLEFATEAARSDGEDFVIGAWTAYSLGKKGKIYAMGTAMGEDMDAIRKRNDEAKRNGTKEGRFYLESLKGKKLRGTVIHETKENGEVRHKISTFLPIPTEPVRKNNRFASVAPPTEIPPAEEAPTPTDNDARKAALLADED